MTAQSLNIPNVDRFRLRQTISWRDPDIDCTVVVSQPETDPLVVGAVLGRCASQLSQAWRRVRFGL